MEFWYKWVHHSFNPKIHSLIQNNIGGKIDDGLNFVTCEEAWKFVHVKANVEPPISRTHCAQVHRSSERFNHEILPLFIIQTHISSCFFLAFQGCTCLTWIGFFWSNRHSSGRKLLPFVSKLFIVTEKSCGFNRRFQPQLPQFWVSVMLTHIVRFGVWQGISRIFQFLCSQVDRGKLDGGGGGIQVIESEAKEISTPPITGEISGEHFGVKWYFWPHFFSKQFFPLSRCFASYIVLTVYFLSNPVFILWENLYVFPNTDVEAQRGYLTSHLSPSLCLHFFITFSKSLCRQETTTLLFSAPISSPFFTTQLMRELLSITQLHLIYLITRHFTVSALAK